MNSGKIRIGSVELGLRVFRSSLVSKVHPELLISGESVSSKIVACILEKREEIRSFPKF